MKQTFSKAFTIIELLIVIVVIGILVAIVFVGYSAVQSNAQDNATKADLNKLGDSLNIKLLDTKGVLAGGATSAGAGDATVFSGVIVSANKSAYDTSTTNLFFCSGTIDNVTEFALIGKAKSGKIFSFKSNGGLSELSSSTAMTYDALCPAAGFTDPYSWSYAYNPNPIYGWFAWANGEAPTITNLARNPKGIGAAEGWFSSIVSTITETTSVPWNGRTDWHRFVWDGTGASTVRLNMALSDLTNGQTYTTSMLVGNSDTVAATWTMDLADASVTSFSLNPGEMKRISFSGSKATYDSTYRFVDFNLTSANPAGLLVNEVMITKGTDLYLYRDGSSAGWTWNGTANASTSTGLGQQ